MIVPNVFLFRFPIIGQAAKYTYSKIENGNDNKLDRFIPSCPATFSPFMKNTAVKVTVNTSIQPIAKVNRKIRIPVNIQKDI